MLPLRFLKLFGAPFYLSGLSCLRCWVKLFDLFLHIPVQRCVELHDVSLPAFFLCFSERL